MTVLEIVMVVLLTLMSFGFFLMMWLNKDLYISLRNVEVTPKDKRALRTARKAIEKDINEALTINKEPLKLEGFPNLTDAVDKNPKILHALANNSSFFTPLLFRLAGVNMDNPVYSYIANSSVSDQVLQSILKYFINSRKEENTVVTPDKIMEKKIVETTPNTEYQEFY